MKHLNRKICLRKYLRTDLTYVLRNITPYRYTNVHNIRI